MPGISTCENMRPSDGMQLKRYCFSPFTVVGSSLANILCEIELALLLGHYFVVCIGYTSSGIHSTNWKRWKIAKFLSQEILLRFQSREKSDIFKSDKSPGNAVQK